MTDTPKKVGPWILGKEKGSGGQARVFEAWKDGEASSILALKLIRTARPKKKERFRKEVEIHASLSSRHASNIMPIIDHNIQESAGGEIQGYIVMPLAWKTLDEISDTLVGRIELCLEVFRGVTVGIAEAHGEGAIHRDIKPKNVLFLDSSLKEPLVSDFGICFLRDTADEHRITDEGETVGARFFMAPEQEEGGPVDVSETADIYALGKLLHFMVTGRYLTREELERAFTEDELKSDTRLKLIHERILSRTIVKNPGSRISSARELLGEIDALRSALGTPTGNSPALGPTPASHPPRLESTQPPLGTELDLKYHEITRQLVDGKAKSVALAFDDCQRAFSEEWNTLYLQTKDKPKEAESAARLLIHSQPLALAAALAMARLDEAGIFRDFRRFIEFVTRFADSLEGYPEISGVPNVLAGFLYMASAVVALASESWNVLSALMRARFPLYNHGGRPSYEYGFEHHQFFHSPALQHYSSRAHDLFRAELGKEDISRVTGLSGERLLDIYVQTQMLMCLRGAQLCIQGKGVRMFADFGRFYESRARPLIDKMHADPEYANGICQSFGEDASDFFASIKERLELIRRAFWGEGPFHWVSFGSWESD